jgi:hypothetical protein
LVKPTEAGVPYRPQLLRSNRWIESTTYCPGGVPCGRVTVTRQTPDLAVPAYGW